MTPDEIQQLAELQPNYFSITKRGGWLYCQLPTSASRHYLARVSTYVSTFQLNSISVAPVQESVEDAEARIAPQVLELMRKRGAKPGIQDRKVLAWHLVAGLNDSSALADSSEGIAYAILAARETLDEILGEQEALLQALDEKAGDAAAPTDLPADTQDVPDVLDDTEAVPETPADDTQNQSPTTELFSMSDDTRKLMIEQLKTRLDNPSDADDPTLGIDPLALLPQFRKKNDG